MTIDLPFKAKNKMILFIFFIFVIYKPIHEEKVWPSASRNG